MNPTLETQKKSAAESALAYIEYGMTLGVGSGSTVHYFIDALKSVKAKIDAVVASSVETEKRVKALGIPVIELNSVSHLPLYVDGADEINAARQMIKGGGAALTREKIIAAASDKFVCIVDQSKQVDLLGAFPVPVEVIPMARSFVARQIVKLGGRPEWRENVMTDNGNQILDVHNFKILNPLELETTLNQIPGVVTNGIFARRIADVVIVGK